MNATNKLLSLAASTLLTVGLIPAQVTPGTGAHDDANASAGRHDDQAGDLPQLWLLRERDDGSLSFQGRRLEDLIMFVLLVSTRPDVQDMPTLGAQILREPLVAAAGRLDGDSAWTGGTFDAGRLGEVELSAQLIGVKADGSVQVSRVIAVDANAASRPDRIDDGLDFMAGRHADCDDAQAPARYDGPELQIEVQAVHYLTGQEPGRQVAVVFDAPSTGYALHHFESVEDQCGTDVYFTLDQPWDGDVVLPVIERHEARAPVAAAGRVRVLVGRIRQDGDILYWDFQLAETFEATR